MDVDSASSAPSSAPIDQELPPSVWTCAACGHAEAAPMEEGVRLRRAHRWTKVRKHYHVCPTCTRQANRDSSRQLRNMQQLDGPHLSRHRESMAYGVWWDELLASLPQNN